MHFSGRQLSDDAGHFPSVSVPVTLFTTTVHLHRKGTILGRTNVCRYNEHWDNFLFVVQYRMNFTLCGCFQNHTGSFVRFSCCEIQLPITIYNHANSSVRPLGQCHHANMLKMPMLTRVCLRGKILITVTSACLLIGINTKYNGMNYFTLAAVNHLPFNHILSDHCYIQSNVHVRLCYTTYFWTTLCCVPFICMKPWHATHRRGTLCAAAPPHPSTPISPLKNGPPRDSWTVLAAFCHHRMLLPWAVLGLHCVAFGWCTSSNIHLNAETHGFPAEHSIVVVIANTDLY